MRTFDVFAATTGSIVQLSIFAFLSLTIGGCIVNPVPTPGGAAAESSDDNKTSFDAGAAQDVFTGGMDNDTGSDTDMMGDTGMMGDAGTSPEADSGSMSGDATSGEDVSPDATTTNTGGPDAGSVAPDSGVTKCPNNATKQVLFLGNSYTHGNNLPKMFADLAKSVGKTVITEAVMPGGFTLGANPNAHATNKQSLDMLVAKPWDYVVLQEQSQIPTIIPFKNGAMLPGAKKLVSHLRKSNQCAKVLMFLTWGRKKGGKQCAGSTCSANFKDFGQMQDALTAGYLDVAKQIDAGVVPVGESWRKVIDANGPDLFDGDGSHPNVHGSFLAAATFYAAIFQASPTKAKAPAAINDKDRQLFIKHASDTVLDNLAKWSL